MMSNVPFPWRAEDLPAGSFWFRSAHNTHDYGAKRKTAGGNFDGSKENSSNPNENTDKVAYGVPIYAIADGEVVASWRNAPDNIRPGESHPGRLSDPQTIPRSGNFVLVLCDDGNVINYAHMKPGSVPSALCPFNAEFVTNANIKAPPPGAPQSKACVETILPAANRPRVKKGQYLGRVGNAGASSGPHLHMTRTAPDGTADYFTHDRAWKSTTAAPDTWTKFNGETIGADDLHIIISASPLLRRGDASAGSFHEAAMHFVRSHRLVTAIRDSNNELKLITWGMTPPEEFVRRGEESAGDASAIAIAEPRSDIVVTAMRDGNGNLRLISWRIEDNGDVTRCNTIMGGSVSKVSLVTSSTGVVVSAVRTAAGELMLIGWSVAPNGDFHRRGQASAGPIQEVALQASAATGGVITAVRTASGNLKLIAWQVTDSGASITRRGDAEADSAHRIAMVMLGNNDQFVLTANRDSAGNLRMRSWQIANDGNSIETLGTTSAGEVSEVAIARVPNVDRSAVVACRDGEGSLRLITWEIFDQGQSIARWGGALAGTASQIAIAGTSDGSRDFFVTACADAGGNLKLISWEANL